MIFDFNHLQWQPMDRWPIAYRYTQERWNKLDPRTLATIRPLADVSAFQLAAVHDLDGLVTQARSNLLSEGWEILAIDDGDPISTKSWLRRQRPRAEDDVYVEWAVAGSCAAVVAWKTLCRFFDDFWYPFEVVLVSDDTGVWRILFGPNDVVRWRTLIPGTGPANRVRRIPKYGLGQIPDIDKYRQMKDSGFSPRQVYLALLEDGAITLEAVRAIRLLFGLSLRDACEAGGLRLPPES